MDAPKFANTVKQQPQQKWLPEQKTKITGGRISTFAVKIIVWIFSPKREKSSHNTLILRPPKPVCILAGGCFTPKFLVFYEKPYPNKRALQIACIRSGRRKEILCIYSSRATNSSKCVVSDYKV